MTRLTVRARYAKMLDNDSLLWEALGPDGVKESQYKEVSREVARAIYARDALKLGRLLLNQADDYIERIANNYRDFDDSGELRCNKVEAE